MSALPCTLLLALALVMTAEQPLHASEDSEASPPVSDVVSEAVKAPDLPAAMTQELPDRLRIPFTLSRTLTVFPEPLLSSGELIIDRRQQAVRWAFKDEVTLILVGDSLRRFGPNGEEESVNLSRDPGAAALKRQMAGFRDADWAALDELFTITTSSAEVPPEWAAQLAEGEDLSTALKLTLSPANDDLKRLISELTVLIDPRSHAPIAVDILNANGDHTAYRFGQAAINPELDPSLFTGP